MSANLKPYPAMKDSGVPWLGEVPDVLDSRATQVVEAQHRGATPPKCAPPI